MHDAVAAIAACNVSPIVRIPATEGWMVKRALDAGAHGIVVPLIRHPSEVTTLVSTAKFPPLGIRGFGSPFAPHNFGAGLKQPSQAPTPTAYLAQANASLLTIVQIETAAALDHLPAIAATPGVDVLFVGPYDLGIAIGCPIDEDGVMRPDLVAAVESVRDAAVAHGKVAGMYCNGGEQAAVWRDKGFAMISIACDAVALPAYFGTQLATARAETAGKT